MRQRRCPAPRQGRATSSAAAAPDELVLTRPDDWHLHVRDGAGLASVVPHTAAHYGRAVIMPNLVPPVTTAAAADEYRGRVLAAVPPQHSSSFTPLMTCYLTDNTPPEEVQRAKEAGVVAFKLYPAGATTNSDSGVTDWALCLPTLRAMAEVRGGGAGGGVLDVFGGAGACMGPHAVPPPEPPRCAGSAPPAAAACPFR